MHAQLFFNLLRYSLPLLFWLSFVDASPLPKLTPRDLYSHLHFQTPRTPPPEAPIVHSPVLSHYNLKFKKYSEWLKDRSEFLWESREDHRTLRGYVSPYLTQFEAKKDGWWASVDFGRILRRFLWETIPEWLGGPDPEPKEDVFLLRAMERPSYMSIEELQEIFPATAR